MDLYLDNIKKRYHAAKRKEKSLILNELCAASGYHKKHAIRMLNQKKEHCKPDKKKRGRKPKYQSSDYLEPLKRIWLYTDQLCGKRLKMALPLWLPYYGTIYDELDPQIYEGLLKMSASTTDRMLSGAYSTPSRSQIPVIPITNSI